jgi:hypothetical protein
MDGVTAPEVPTPQPPAGYGTYPPYPPPVPVPVPDPRRRRLLIAVSVAWGLALATTGIWYALHGSSTAREQTTIARAQPTVDRAVQDMIKAAGGSVVPAVSGYERDAGCSVTSVRGGVKYQRLLWLYTTPESEAALLDRIVGGLPARYRARTYQSVPSGVHTLTADAGDYVSINGSVDRPGLVRIVTGTGCRTLGHLPAADPSAVPAPGDRVPVDAALRTLGVSAAAWATHVLPCGVRTVEATGPLAQPATALRSAGSLVDRPDVHADRAGLAVRVDGSTVTVSVTTGSCGG